MKVGLRLSSQRGNKGVNLPLLATSLGISDRSLRNWRLNVEKTNVPPLGRSSHSKEIHRNAIWKVGRELRRQCYPGWRPVAAACGTTVPLRLVQQYVSLFKERRKKRIDNRIKQNRIQTQVVVRNAIWTQDGTHLGRDGQHPIEAQVIKDRAPLRTVVIEVGPPAIATTVIDMLDKNKSTRGLPFVFSTDNGSPYCNDVVEVYLEQEKVIHLRSLPRTPEHNGAAEIGIREIKHAALLGKGVHTTIAQASHCLGKSIAKLDGARLLATKGFKTAKELDETLPVTQERDRDLFYSICRTRMQQVAVHAKNAREARRFEREMVFCTLEDFGLIKRQRGGQPYASHNAEIFS